MTSAPKTHCVRLCTHSGHRRTQEVREVVLAAQPARPRKHAGVGLLHQILGILPVPGERPGSPEEAVEMIAERVGFQPPQRRGRRLWHHDGDCTPERHAAQLTVSVPFMPAALWPGTGQ